MTKISIVPFAIGYGSCINDFGQICGSISTQTSPSSRSYTVYLRQPDGALIPLPNMAVAVAMNQSGHVVGYDNAAANVYLYANGQSTNLGHIPGIPTDDYFPTSVNNFDTVVGEVFGSIETGWCLRTGRCTISRRAFQGRL